MWGGLTLAALLVELGLGATMRHNSAGLAIPDFPLAYGGVFPPFTSFPIVINYSHRVGAVVVLVLVALTLWETLRRHRHEPVLMRPAVLMGVLVVAQVFLGALSIWSQLAVPVTTLHVANGALLFGATGLLTLRGKILEYPAVAEG